MDSIDSQRSAEEWLSQVRRRSWPSLNSNVAPLRIADLFAGCGGLTLGAYLASQDLQRDMIVDLAVDNWEAAVNVYRDNFGALSLSIRNDDVATVLTSEFAGLDVLLAGPPCQGHSDLNNSTRRSDPRNEHYLAPVRFALLNRPKVLLIENVPSVIHSREGVVDRAMSALEDAGYQCISVVLDVSTLGIPQKRKRHLLVGSLVHDASQLQSLSAHLSSGVCRPRVIDFISDLQDSTSDENPLLAVSRVSKENQGRIDYLFDRDVYDLPNSLRPSCHRDKLHSYISMYGRIRPDSPAQTITSGFGSMGQGRFVHPTRPRMLTVREASRIQGFPDYFDFSRIRHVTLLRRMVANAVPPAMSRAVISYLFGAP